MGTFSFCVRSGTNMIKTLLATCLVVAANAELILSTDTDTPLSPSDLPLVWTLSPRDSMPLPRDMPLMPTTDTDTTDSSTERGPLTLMLSTDSDTPLFPSDPPLVWPPSPRDWMPLPRDTLLMLTMDTDTTDSSMELTWDKFDGRVI